MNKNLNISEIRKIATQNGIPIRTSNGTLIPKSVLVKQIEAKKSHKNIIFKPCPPNGAVSSHQGRRPTMEDTHVYASYQDIKLYAVFDGHGGHQVSNLLSKLLPTYIFRNLQDSKNKTVKQAIIRSFLEVDTVLFKLPEVKEAGSTAIVAILIGRKLYIANLGDSRALLFNNRGLVFSTADHKPESPSESKRIYELGGHVKVYGVARTNGQIATSRSFGDFKGNGLKTDVQGNYLGHRAPLSPVPDIKIIDLTTSNNYLILACDGLWDVYKNSEIIKYYNHYISKNISLDKLCDNLVHAAINDRGSTDNVSVMAIRIN